jgi:hypothetical protein
MMCVGCEKLQLVSVSFKMLALCILAIIVYVSVATCGVGSFGIASQGVAREFMVFPVVALFVVEL